MRRLWFAVTLGITGLVAALLYLNARPAALPDSDIQTLRVANELFEGGETADAIELYEQLVEQGVESPDVFYNLGNAYYATGRTGLALYFLLRAEQIAPRDEDIDANLALVRDEIGRTRLAQTLPEQILMSLEGALTLDEIALLTLGLWALTAFALLAVRLLPHGFVRRLGTFGLVALAVLFVASAALFGRRLYARAAEPLAVVVTDQALVSPMPGPPPSNALTLPGGAEVRVVGREGNWVQVNIVGTQSQGWIDASAVRVAGG